MSPRGTASEPARPGAAGHAPAPSAAPWPVVLGHGTRTSHIQGDLQLPFLHAAGHPTRTPDLPGHGSRRGEPFGLEAARDTIIAVVREEHRRTGLPGHRVGSSRGGMLAIHAVARLCEGSIELLADGDHMVNLKAPGRFAADLLRVLARVEREQGRSRRGHSHQQDPSAGTT